MERPIEKERHGCFTAWIIVLALWCVYGLAKSLFFPADLSKVYPDAPAWLIPLGTILAIANLAFVFALFRWKRIGFWGYCVTAAIQIPLALMVSSHMKMPDGRPMPGFVPIISAVIPVLFIALLFGVLQIGGTKKAWPQLE